MTTCHFDEPQSEIEPKASCGCGIDRSVWKSFTVDSRPGQVRTECSKCGRFIGWCPEETFRKGTGGEKQEYYSQEARDRG